MKYLLAEVKDKIGPTEEQRHSTKALLDAPLAVIRGDDVKEGKDVPSPFKIVG